MNVAQARPRTWTPQIILFSILLHAAVIYYVAVAFNIVPPIVPDTSEPPVIQTVRLPPPPPPVDPDPVVPHKLPLRQHLPKTPPVQPIVPPTPFQPAITPGPAGPVSMDVREVIQEQPVSQLLPAYPPRAVTQEIQGKVRLSITIMPDGSVRDVRVVDARPPGYFENSAVAAVQRWRYRPSNVIRTNVLVDIDYVLR